MIKIVAILFLQAVFGWSVALLVRTATDRLSVGAANLLICGLPLVAGACAFVYVLRQAFQSRSRFIQQTLVCSSVAVLSAISAFTTLLTVYELDDHFAERYILRMNRRLVHDPRFTHVRVTGVSRDFLLLPYHTLSGIVAAQADRDALYQFLRSSWTPGYLCPHPFGVMTKAEAKERNMVYEDEQVEAFLHEGDTPRDPK